MECGQKKKLCPVSDDIFESWISFEYGKPNMK